MTEIEGKRFEDLKIAFPFHKWDHKPAKFGPWDSWNSRAVCSICSKVFVLSQNISEINTLPSCEEWLMKNVLE